MSPPLPTCPFCPTLGQNHLRKYPGPMFTPWGTHCLPRADVGLVHPYLNVLMPPSLVKREAGGSGRWDRRGELLDNGVGPPAWGRNRGPGSKISAANSPGGPREVRRQSLRRRLLRAGQGPGPPAAGKRLLLPPLRLAGSRGAGRKHPMRSDDAGSAWDRSVQRGRGFVP